MVERIRDTPPRYRRKLVSVDKPATDTGSGRFADVTATLGFGQDDRNTNRPNTNTHFAVPTFSSLREWKARKQALREQILLSAGLVPMPAKTPLNAQIFGRLDRDGYSIEKVLIETLPGYYLEEELPSGEFKGKHPGILIAHGHWDYRNSRTRNSTPRRNQGITMAQQGYVVFAYDMVG